MKLQRENVIALAILAVVLLLNGWALRAELQTAGVDLNDNVLHFRIIAGIASALERGANPLDFWSPEWSFGFPVVRVYQPLAHLLVVLVYFALGKIVTLLTVFVWFRFLAMALLPASVFFMVRCFRLPLLTAAAAALLAPLISTPHLYGLEYESYVWAGFGLFPQAVAANFLLLTVGCAWRALRGSGSATLTGVLLAVTLLCQFVYGYMGALSICLLALLPSPASTLLVRCRRVLWIAAVSLLLSAFQMLPVWLDRSLINPLPADQKWKSDSFGAAQVLQWLAGGELLDHDRIPVLSLLAAAGMIVLALRHLKPAGMEPAGKFALAGAAFWVLVFFGRPFWGPALYLLGITADLHLHRVLAAAQIFLLVLAAIALAAMWQQLSRRLHAVVAVAVTLVLLYPLAAERMRYLDLNATQLQRSVRAMQKDRPALDALLAALRQRGGRAFAGLATPSSWGPSFRIGDVPMYHAIASAGVPTVGYLSHTMALTSGIQLDFDERNAEHYRLFDVTSFIVPAGTKYPVPPFLKPGPIFGRFQIYDTPANGYFDLVDVSASQPFNREDFLAVNEAWLKSDAPRQRRYLRFDASPAPPVPAAPPGEIVAARQSGGMFDAAFDAARPAWALFKMTWHPNWKAAVDGRPAQTAMLSPGFIGVSVPAGRHTLTLRYQPADWKLWLALAGIIGALAMAFAERRILPRSD